MTVAIAIKTEIDPRMIKARSALVQRQPFYGTLAMYLVLVEDDSIGTMATDGSRLIYSRKFVDELVAEAKERNLPSDALIIGVIAHEVSHCSYRHHTRRAGRKADLWNDAGDYAINRDLIRAGFHLPKCALLDAQFDGMGADTIYRVLDVEQEKKQQQQGGGKSQPQQGGDQAGAPQPGTADQSGQPQAGQGGAGKPVPDRGRTGGVIDAAPDHDKAEIAEQDSEWEARVREALAVAARQHGTLPGHMQNIMKAADEARVDWKEPLRRFITSKCKQDYSFARPNRQRLATGFYFPGLVADGISHLGIAIDTSGSTTKFLKQFASEVIAAFEECAIEKLTIVYCDTRVTDVQTFERGEEIIFKHASGGGTAFAPAISWFEENEPDVGAMIYFTDLDADDFGNEPAFPVMWAVCRHDPRSTKTAPFGEVIEVF